MELNPRRQLYLKILIDHFHPKSSKEVISIACESELAQLLLNIKAPIVSFSDLFTPTEEVLKKIHYSWILKSIRKFPSSLHSLLISSLPKEQVQGIALFLNQKELMRKKLPQSTKKFFQIILRKEVTSKKVMEEAFLPLLPLSELLQLDKPILIELIDLIGLYDLAIKMKVIIDRNLISKINQAFPEKKVQFLHMIMNQKKKIQAQDFNLRSWDENPESLRKMVHKRGLSKLAIALSGYPKDFLWHLTRRFDTGRGKLLLDNYSQNKLPLAPQITEQIFFIINTLNPKSRS